METVREGGWRERRRRRRSRKGKLNSATQFETNRE